MQSWETCPIPLIVARERLGGRDPYHDPALTRIHPGVYVERDGWNALAPWKRYAARVHAVHRTWDAPVFCLESAAALLGLPLFGEPRHVHVIGRSSTTPRGPGVAVHTYREARETTESDGITTTAVADTVLDLSRMLPPAFALSVADAALHRKLATAAELRERATSCSTRRGLRQLRWVLGEATPESESVNESVSRATIGWLGYERPDLQTWFHYEGAHDRSDFYWPRHGVIGEADGYGKYDAADVEASKALFIAEKEREDRLRRHEHGFARWAWRDAVTPRNLDGKLRAAGLVPVRAPNATLLGTLGHNPRSLPRPGRP